MANTNNNEITSWVGWLGFASFMLLFVGFFHIIEGVAFRARQAVFVHSSGDVWVLNYSKWGWINIIGGILLVIAALTLIKGGMVGRVFASLVVLLSMLASATLIPTYPLWAILVIVFDALILYAITIRGLSDKRLS